MNKEEFIGKLEMVYVGDRNAFNEIVEDNQKLKNEIVYSKVEIDRLNNLNKQLVGECQRLDDEETRLNNIINKLEKWLIENKSGDISYSYSHTLNKLQELKVENK